jgi:hypothetical protein
LASRNGTSNYQRLHAVDITTGQDVLPPTTIDSSIYVPGSGPEGDGTYVYFDPKQHRDVGMFLQTLLLALGSRRELLAWFLCLGHDASMPMGRGVR